MSGDDSLPFFHYFAQAIVERIRAVDEELGAIAEEFSKPYRHVDLSHQIIAYAVLQSVFELTETSSQKNFYEEHQTSALMGHLVSNLFSCTVCAFTACGDIEEQKAVVPAIQWAYQDKESEPGSGVDFGVVKDIGVTKDGNASVRLILFQAKRAEFRGSLDSPKAFISVDHITGAKAKRDKLSKIQSPESARTSAKPKKSDLILTRRRQLQAMLESAGGHPAIGHAAADLLDRVDKFGESLDEAAHFQLEAFLRTYFRGQKEAKTLADWCYYVAWHPSHNGLERTLPSAISIGSVAREVQFHSLDFSAVPAVIPLTQGSDFIEVLCGALIGCAGIEVGLNNAVKLAGELSVLLPGLSLLLSEESSGGGQRLAESFSQSGWKVSPSLIGLQAIAQTKSPTSESAPELDRSNSATNIRGM